MKFRGILTPNGIASLILLWLPSLSMAQGPSEKLDSLIRKFPGGRSELLIVFDSIWEQLEKETPPERIVDSRRMVRFIDSVQRMDDGAITAYGLYQKGFLEKNLLSLPYEGLQTTMEATEEADKTNDNSLLFLCLAQAAMINREIENYGEVVRLGVRAIGIYEKLELPADHYDKEILSLLSSVGASQLELGQFDQASKTFDEAEELSIKYNNATWLAIIGSDKAILYTRMGRNQEALKLFIKAFDDIRKGKRWRAASEQAVRIADLYILENKLGMAQSYLDSARSILDDTPNHAEAASIFYWKHVTKLELAKGNYRRAFEAQEKYIGEYLELKRVQQATMTTNMQASYEFERNQNTIVTLRHDNERQRTFAIVSVIILALLGILAAYFIYSYRRQRKAARYIAMQRDELEKQGLALQEKNVFIQHQHDEIETRNLSLNKVIVELKKTQAQLIHSEKMSSLGQLTAGLMHEINNPINFVQTGTEALQEDLKVLFDFVREYEKTDASNFQDQAKKILKMKEDLDYESLLPGIQSLLKTIRNGSERTASIVSNLHSFSRKGEEESREFAIAEPLEMTLSLIANELRARINVTTHFEPGLTVEGREIDLQQAFMNILVNAAQAITGQGNITITTSREGGNAIVSIRDDGPGIPEEIRGKIFDPFFTTRPVGKGMGLGLSITHSIIKGHSGGIEVRNHPQGGAEFIITIPLRIK